MMIRGSFCVVLLLAVLSDVHAGEFNFAIDAKNKAYITYDGRIEIGDADKFHQLLVRERYNFLHVHGLIVNSPGGSVNEALKLAELVESSGLRLDVSKDGVCASSCFFIYVSAPVRFSTSPVIIHRPYYDMGHVIGEDGPAYEQAYRNAFARTRSYLSDRLVPNYLIEKMMTKGSSQGYTLTSRDIMAINVMSPAVSEYSQQNCYLPRDRLATAQELESWRSCVDDYLFYARFNLLFGENAAYAREKFFEVNAYSSNLRISNPRCHGREEYARSLKKVIDSQPPENWLPLAKQICARLH